MPWETFVTALIQIVIATIVLVVPLCLFLFMLATSIAAGIARVRERSLTNTLRGSLEGLRQVKGE